MDAGGATYSSRRHYILWRELPCDAHGAMPTKTASSTHGRPTAARPSVGGASVARARAGTRRSNASRTSASWSSSETAPRSRSTGAKLAGSIRKALADRPVTPTEVEIMVDRIQARLRRRGPEIASHLVGHEVLAALRRTDEVAYLRFASVYKEFEGVADFEREMVSLQKKASRQAKAFDADTLHVVVCRISSHIMLTSGPRGPESPSRNHTGVVFPSVIHTSSTCARWRTPDRRERRGCRWRRSKVTSRSSETG